MAIGLSHFVRPFQALWSELPTPSRRIPFREKVMYTTISLFVFLVCSELPLYGVRSTTGSDPFRWIRLILASNPGTVMELGLTPILVSRLVMGLLSNNLCNAVQKLIGIVIAIGAAVVCVVSGMYGSLSQIGTENALLIILQLGVANAILMCLDELLRKGYGLGYNPSMFITTNLCQTIFWKAFSPATVNSGRGVEFEGAIIALFHLLKTRTDKIEALFEAFHRQNFPNLTSLLATLNVLLVVVYIQGFRLVLPAKSKNAQRDSYLMKLFYKRNLPVTLLCALAASICFVSQVSTTSRRFW